MGACVCGGTRFGSKGSRATGVFNNEKIGTGALDTTTLSTEANSDHTGKRQIIEY